MRLALVVRAEDVTSNLSLEAASDTKQKPSLIPRSLFLFTLTEGVPQSFLTLHVGVQLFQPDFPVINDHSHAHQIIVDRPQTFAVLVQLPCALDPCHDSTTNLT